MPKSPNQGTITPQLGDLSASNSTEKSSKSRQASCHTCRRQRLRCDAAKPSCQKCLTRGVECLGYGAQAILWVRSNAPGQDGNSTGVATFVEPGEQRTAKGKKKGRPKLVLMPKIRNESNGSSQVSSRSQSQSQLHRDAKWVVVNNEEARDRVRSLVKRKQAVSSGLTPVGYYNDSLALSMLEYMNQYIVTDMVLLDTGANPHRIPLQYWKYFPDLAMDMIISCCLTHQVIRCHATQDSFPLTSGNAGHKLVPVTKHRMVSFQNPSIGDIFKHQQRALKQLGEDLNDKDLRYSDVILGIIITLMRVEIQQSAFGAWPTHLHAARTIVADRGGFKKLLLDEGALMGEALTTYMLMDILSAIFTPGTMLDPHSTVSQLEYIPLLDVSYKNGRNSDFPCANQLLECIIRINHARLLAQSFIGDSPDLDMTSAQIFCRIVSFDPAFWSRTQLRELLFSPPGLRLPSEASSCASSSSSSGDDESTLQMAADALPITHAALHSMAEDLAIAFQCAVMLYCIRTLYLDRGKSLSDVFASPLAAALLSQEKVTIDIENPYQSALDGLLEALHRLWATEKSSGSAWIGKLSFWPLWVAGMEMDPSEEMAHERAFVCASLRGLCYYLGAMGPLDAVSALQVVWATTASQNGEGQQATWDSKLVMPGIRGVFFF